MQRYCLFSNSLFATGALCLSLFLVGLLSNQSMAQDKATAKDKAAAKEQAESKESGSDSESGDEEGEEKKKEVAGKVTCKLVMTNEEEIVPDFAGTDFVLEEQYVADNPDGLPENWDDMPPEEKMEWGKAFVASPAGVAYKKAQDEKFANRRKIKVIIDDTGGFELKDVPFGPYILAGTIKGKDAKGKRYSADVVADIPIGDQVEHIDLVDLKELGFTMYPELLVGDLAPDVTFEELNGKRSMQLSKLRGKYVLLDFWATWCGPCLKATPSVRRAYSNHAGKLEVIGISQDEERDKAVEFVIKKEYPWLQAHAESGSQIHTEFGVQSIPSFWLIGPDGKVAATPQDFRDKKLDIEAVLKEIIK